VGLFDFLKRDKNDSDVAVLEEVEKQNNFKPITIDTTNVERDLQRVSKKFNIDIKKLDFTLISYRTFYRFDKESKYRPITSLNSEEILTKDNFLNPDFNIRQQYKINIFEKKSNSFAIKISLASNKDFTKVTALFKKTNNISFYKSLDSEIYRYINNKKLRLGLLIGIFDDKLKENIKKVTSHIMVNKYLSEDIKIDICEGFHRIEESGEFVNLIYKDKKEQKDRGSSLKDRSNLFTVKEGELIIEVLKPQTGQNGRNCKGEFLPRVSLGKNFSNLKYEECSFGKNIEKVELDEKIQFFAKVAGYVIQDGNSFDISDDVVVEQVNLKTTGSIEAEDSEIKVNVQNSDESIDAIASGVVLNTKEVKAKGNVGNNAKIKAEIVEIDGQTHQSSFITGEKVKIHLHKGFVEGSKVDIGTLEGGVVIGDEVFINTLSGGEIKAKKIFVNRVISNATLIASDLIEVNELDGNSNKFIIDPRAQRGYEKLVSKMEDELKSIELELNKDTRELKAIKKKIMSEKDSIEEVKKVVQEFKSKNKKAPTVMINKLKDDQANKLEFNKIMTKIKDLKVKRDEIVEKLNNFNNVAFDSTVVINSPWKEYNEVIFKIVEPKKEIKRAMDENEVANRLGLKVTKDNEYIIANLE